MAGELLTLETRGIGERAAFFRGAAARAEDLTPVWDFTHDVWLHEIAQQFLTQGRYFGGEEWAPLNPQYARKKLRDMGGPPPAPLGILYKTGHLFEALTNAGSGEHIFAKDAQSVLLGATGEAARIGGYHQRGAVIEVHDEEGGSRMATLPVRKIIGMRERFKATVFRAAVTYITGGQLPRQGS